MMEVSPATVLVSAHTEYVLSMKRHCTVRWRYRNYRMWKTWPTLQVLGWGIAVFSKWVSLLNVVQQFKKKKKGWKQSECKQLNVSVIILLEFWSIKQVFLKFFLLLIKYLNKCRLYLGFILISGCLQSACWFFSLRSCKPFSLFAWLKLKSSTTEIICRVWTEEMKKYWLARIAMF